MTSFKADKTLNEVMVTPHIFGLIWRDLIGGGDMEISCLGWAVVVAKPAAEFVAKDALRRRGYRVCLPVYRKVMRGKRQNYGELVMRPLFKGYLFAELAPGQPWVSILYTPGVSQIVRCTGEDIPALLEPELIEAICVEAEAGVFDEPRISDGGVSRAAFRGKPGDQIRVSDGPFTSLMATLQDVDENGRAQTLLTFFNREVPVEMGLEALAGVAA
jgi:transcription antitermination factor NusG